MGREEGRGIQAKRTEAVWSSQRMEVPEVWRDVQGQGDEAGADGIRTIS